MVKIAENIRHHRGHREARRQVRPGVLGQAATSFSELVGILRSCLSSVESKARFNFLG